MQTPMSLTPPCPVGGDLIILCEDVKKEASSFTTKCLCSARENETPYFVFDNGDDSMTFVVQTKDTFEKHFKVLSLKSGFDSTVIWSLAALEQPEREYLMCLHVPVSGRKPIPDNLKQYFVDPDIIIQYSDSFFWIYDLTDKLTLAQWRDKRGVPDPDEVYAIACATADTLKSLHEAKHYLLRFNAETTLLGDEVRFLGVSSLDLPWNESCAQQNGALEFNICIAPECRGYIKELPSVASDVYAFGALLYYMIANVNPPICEAFDFECPLAPRVFAPSFPFGWDAVIMRSILPSPMRRYSSINELLNTFADRYETICDRLAYHAPLSYDASVDTYIGITKRLRCPVNQDAVFLRHSKKGQRFLIAVADGVSTSKYGSGDIASSLLVNAAESVWNEYLCQNENIDAKEAVSDILHRCNTAICDYIRANYADENPTAADSMGTTALIGIVDNGVFTLGSIGDSRCYLIREDSVVCITRDHNLFTMATINGMPVQQCAVHPYAGSLVQCLGFFEDLNNPNSENLAFDTYAFNMMPGDHILMTTDGLLDYAAQDIRDAEAIIARTVLQVANPALACLELILIANRGGGGDNTGIGLLYVDKPFKDYR